MNEEGTPDQDGIGQGGLETEATGPGITPGPFAELVGQQPAIAQLSAALQRPVPAYLFVGQTGWGTRRAADIFAGELLARHDPETADRHRRLAAAESHPAIAVVERTGAAISVEEARDIARRAELAPPEGSHQVLVLVDFHLVRNAAPALLKTIEEPPASTTFVVLAEEVTPELVTIASRCLRVDFRPIPTEVLVAAAAEEGFDPDAVAVAARAAGGDLERVRALLSDEAASQRWRRWSDLLGRVDGTAATASGLVAELIAGQTGHCNFDTIPWVIYTAPEIAWVGKTEQQLKGDGIAYKVGKIPFLANGRALGMGDPSGFVKMLACAQTDRILGVHIIGANASELISEAVVAMEFAGASEDLARICHAHPTLSEAVHEAALACDKRALNF